jgi:hypothetical protein
MMSRIVEAKPTTTAVNVEETMPNQLPRASAAKSLMKIA